MAKQTTQVGENSTKPTTTSNTSSGSACSSLISHLMKKGTWGIEFLYQVMTNNCENIPNDEGIFLFLTTDTERPEFLSEIQQRKRFKYKKGALSFPVKPTDLKKKMG